MRGQVGLSIPRPAEQGVSALDGADSAPGGRIAPERGWGFLGASRGPLPPGGPPLPSSWGGADFSTGGRNSGHPSSPPPPPLQPPNYPEPLKPWEGQSRWGTLGGGAWQYGSLTRVRFRFLPRSRRDGGETVAVTPALAHPCTTAACRAPRPPPPRQRALPSSDSGLGGQGGRGRPDQRCRRA